MLYYIWENQYFDKTGLFTCQGQSIQIIDPGTRNTNSGPDFSEAHIKIGPTTWVGAVEIHVKSSDWKAHGHHQDTAYDQVILHVVWVNNFQVKSSTGKLIPALELRDVINENSLQGYSLFLTNKYSIPCVRQLPKVPLGVFMDMLNSSFNVRIRKRAIQTDHLYHKTQDWEQVTYFMLGKSFGFKVNAEAFESLVKLVPLNIIRKLRFNLFQLEAMYFGQSGLLNKLNGDHYFRRLEREYNYLKQKYQLSPGYLKREVWRFHRLRPGNSPVLRIAQFASTMQKQYFTFSDIRETTHIGYYHSMNILPSDYWRTHYDFGKSSDVSSGGKLGLTSVENLVINTVIPVLAGYAFRTKQVKYMDRAIQLARSLKSEQNHIVADWKDLGFRVSSAYGSQALLELNNSYCKSHKCLDCKIGQWILSQNN